MSRHRAAPLGPHEWNHQPVPACAKASSEAAGDVKTGSDADFCCLTGVHLLSHTSGVDLCALECGKIKANHMDLTRFT